LIGEPLRERLRSLERRELVGLLLVALLIVGAAVLWYVRSLPASVSVSASIERRENGGTVATPPASPSPTIIVHVAGWVRRPGVYELRQGDRVIDALRMAGGGKGGADLTAVNLAAVLTDGQQILVFKKGAAGGAGGGPVAVAGSGGPAPLVNLNTATLDQLDSLPGIGPTLAQRILDHRTEHGPYRSVDDLLDVSGIGDKRLEDLRSKVTV
jgi:competence protein ComEA